MITITGTIGSGKTTLCRLLRDSLGYELITGGSIFREIAKDKGITVLDVNELAETNFNIDDKVDSFLRDLNGRENIIVDSRLAWYFIDKSFKVYLYADLDTAVNRVQGTNRDTEGNLDDKGELYESIKGRQDAEVKRFKRLYGVEQKMLAT